MKGIIATVSDCAQCSVLRWLRSALPLSNPRESHSFRATRRSLVTDWHPRLVDCQDMHLPQIKVTHGLLDLRQVAHDHPGKFLRLQHGLCTVVHLLK